MSEDLTDNTHILTKIFGISGRVSQGLYAAVGFGLMLFKYGVEAATVLVQTNLFYTPLDFIVPSVVMRQHFLDSGSSWMGWALVVWSVPFLWIATTMSVRRAIDAGFSPWVGLLVVVPCVNLPTMLVLAFTPTRRNDHITAHFSDNFQAAVDAIDETKRHKRMIYSAILGVAIGSMFALAVTVFSVYAIDSYGGSLFIAMPIVSGACAGFIFNQPDMQTLGASMLVGLVSVAMGGLALLLFAFEGVVCLAMAAPLIVPLGAIGGLFGWLIAKTILIQSRYMLGGALMIVPFISLVEFQFKEYKVYVVESQVIVNATPDQVWDNVVSFPDITEPPAWYFKMGIASPLRARIEGRGVNAVRYCEFTTGAFVEPITTWDQPNRLAFDVADQPDPLIELSPYRNIRPPHLQHILQSVRGEFELKSTADGKTILTGRTWYSVDMGPRIYWRLWTDKIIHQIHLRVLDHIRENTEGKKEF